MRRHSFSSVAALRRRQRRQRRDAWYDRPVHPAAYRLRSDRPGEADATTVAMDLADRFLAAQSAATSAAREARWPTGDLPEHAENAVALADAAASSLEHARTDLEQACLEAGLSPGQACDLASERSTSEAADVQRAPANGAAPAPRRQDRLQPRYRSARAKAGRFTGPRTTVTGSTGKGLATPPPSKPAGSVGAGDRASITPAGRAPSEPIGLPAATRAKVIARVWGGRVGSSGLQAKRQRLTAGVDSERARSALHTLALSLPSWGRSEAGGKPVSVPVRSLTVAVPFARQTRGLRDAAHPALRLRA